MKCDLCGAEVGTHISRHVGTERCLRNRISAQSITLLDQKNFSRELGRRVVSTGFVQFLKNNVIHCSEYGLTERCMRKTECVPYDDGYTAADIANIADVINGFALKAGIVIRSTLRDNDAGRVLAAVNSVAGIFFTCAGAEAVRLPAIPWTDAYEKGLYKRLMAAYDQGVSLFNPGIVWTNSFQMLELNVREARTKAEEICAYVKGITAVVHDLCGELVSNSTPHSFYGQVAAPGFPEHGYGQNLAFCIWRFGMLPKARASSLTLTAPARGKKRIRDSDTGCFAAKVVEIEIYPLEPGCGLTACQLGTVKGIVKLTDDSFDDLRRSPAFQRLRVNQIATVVSAVWTDVKPSVRDPYKREASHLRREEAITHQLCEWSKARFATKVHLSKTIQAGR